MLSRYRDGLIALSGCEKGEIPSLISRGEMDNAKKIARFYRNIFKDDFFIELIRHPSRDGMLASYRLASFAEEEGLPVVATNDVHYAEVEEYKIKELLNAIDQNIPVWQLQYCRTAEKYLKSPEQMKKLFRYLPQAMDMTLEIASRCNLDLELGKPHFPRFDIPGGETDFSYLSKLASAGASRKYEPFTTKVRERLEHELETIKSLGFCSYFLVVWDIVR